MFPDVPVFDGLRDAWPDRVTAWDLGKRPVHVRRSDASVLEPDTAIVADCETSMFRALIREHPDPAAAEAIAEEQHQRDLERAAQPPVIEVTVTTPPGGIRRSELDRVVGQAVMDFTGTNPFPAVQPPPPGRRRRGRILQAVSRRSRRRPRLPDLPPVQVSEDDQPTTVIPVFRDEPAVVEVRIP